MSDVPPPPVEAVSLEPPFWNLEQGAEIVPGRYAIEQLGTSDPYETYLAWDDRLHFLVVAKLLRPHLVADEHALSDLDDEVNLLLRLAHPALVRGFGAILGGPR